MVVFLFGSVGAVCLCHACIPITCLNAARCVVY